MTKILKSRKMRLLVGTTAVVMCMSIQAFAASLTTVEIWKPSTDFQATSPNTVYMDYDDTSDWDTNGEHVEKIAWKFFSSNPNHNPDITTLGDCKAEVRVGNDSAGDIVYSYDFDAGQVDQDLVESGAYYLGIKIDDLDSYDYVDMGCRKVFPAPMTVKIPTNLTGDVTVTYVSGSCDGYVKCPQAANWDEIQDDSHGDANYLSNHPHSGDFSIFSSYTTTVDAEGYVTFTTEHGGEYIIY